MGLLPHRSQCVLRHMPERNAETWPGRDCVLFETGEKWTYGRSLGEAYRAANALKNMGIQRGENILLFLPNGAGWLREWWGITALGAVMVPVNHAYKGAMLKHVCMDSQADYIITSPELAGRLTGLGLHLSIIREESLLEGSHEVPLLNAPIEPWDTHAIVYTSGTTGPSKGCITPYFQTYTNACLWWSKATSRDTFLVDLPLFHIGAHCQAHALWSVGGA